MRLAMSGGQMQPGGTLVIETPRQVFEFSCADRGTCHNQKFDNLKFVSEFQVEELSNQFRTYGLGVSSFITKPVTFEGLVDVVKALNDYWIEIVTFPPECTNSD